MLLLAIGLSGAATGAAYLSTTAGETYKCDPGKIPESEFCSEYCKK